MDDFSVWLLDELSRRGWTPAELARRAGLSTGTLSNILNGNRNPGPEVTLSIAKALGEPADKVFRLAGILPRLPGSEDDQVIKEIMDILKNMPPEDRQDVLDYARFRYQKRRQG